jgi:hypothetical protein
VDEARAAVDEAVNGAAKEVKRVKNELERKTKEVCHIPE